MLTPGVKVEFVALAPHPIHQQVHFALGRAQDLGDLLAKGDHQVATLGGGGSKRGLPRADEREADHRPQHDDDNADQDGNAPDGCPNRVMRRPTQNRQ